MTTATTGTGTITLGLAVAGYLTFALAGVVDADVVSYGIIDGSNSETGTGTYTASGTTLSRTVTKSTNSDAAISLTGNAQVFIMARAGDLTDPTFLTSINGGQLAGFRNLLINPHGRINQRGLASNADDTYGHDRWNVLTQTGTIAVSTVTDAENGTPKMWRLTQSQASAQRMGYAQIIEGANCKYLRGKQVTLSGRIKFSLNAAVRYAILEWTGTEDVVTSDVVNDWTNGAFTAGNFFNSTTLNVLGVGSLTPAAATLTDLTALTAPLGSSFNNLIVFIWTEATIAQNATLDGALQLEQGAVATAREFRSATIELKLCQRYFCKSYDIDTSPGSAVIVGGMDNQVPTAGTGPIFFGIDFPSSMRTTPTITLYDSVGTAGKVFKGANGKTGSTRGEGQSGFSLGTTDATSAAELFAQWTAAAEL